MKKQKSTSQHRNDLPGQQACAGIPVVCLGASAGGLEALEQFLRHVPERSGLAFVVIQHLDPNRKGVMPELLQRCTPMTVRQTADGTPVRPDHVYVIPPNKDMSILRGVLHLFEPTPTGGLRLPIDFFLRSLAEDCGAVAVGVILSGMGSDGTMGLRAVKEKAGLVLVQDPAEAKFDSMPLSAIGAGLADIVAPVAELPGKILAYLTHAPRGARPDLALEHKDQSALDKVLILLRVRTGHDFSLYKQSTLYRRIERRMGVHQIDKITGYTRFLQENGQEVELLFNELLIGVTSFFRDPAAWSQLRDEGFPALFARLPAGGVLRAWSVGCSTGEEAYTLAMVFKEALEAVRPQGSFSLQVFATDLDASAIALARRGCYSANIASDLTAQRLQRFFCETDSGFRIGKEIRDMVTFATQNLIMDPPFTRLDILVCRNLLIYLVPELQKKLLPLFHYSLNPGGLLFMGSAETIGSYTDLFKPMHAKSRIYWRSGSLLPGERVSFPAILTPAPAFPKEPDMSKTPENLQAVADQLLLQHFSPPAVLVNEQGDIVYISGRTGRYLEPAAGKANWNIFAMAHEGLRFELSGAFQNALRQQEPVSFKGAKVGDQGRDFLVDVTVQRVTDPAPLRGMVMVVFQDAPATSEGRKGGRRKPEPVSGDRVAELEAELQQRREEISSFREEMQSSQEELKSMNEELQSTNEELQSTNEELTTSKEEMQSMNEELQAVNAEQQARVDELSRLSSDMKNLLDSTEVITVFLDSQLNVRLYTRGANLLFKLIPSDVGRPLSDIVSDLIYPGLLADARDVLRTLAVSEKQLPTTDGRWFSARIMPYLTLENVVDGVVITFADTSEARGLESQLASSRGELDGGGHSLAHGLVLIEVGGEGGFTIVAANPALGRLFGMDSAGLAGLPVGRAIPQLGRVLAKACRAVADSGACQFFEQALPQGDRFFEITVYPCGPGRLGCLIVDPSACRRAAR
jgi:two-component system, chemotaxis family, CheB/CheR fusion protein